MVEQTGCFSLSRIRSFQEGHVAIDDLSPDERIAASRSLFEQLAEAPNREGVINELNNSEHPYYSASNGQVSASTDE